MRLLACLATAVLPMAATASSWPSCLDSGLQPPAPVEREAPPYPEAARLANAEGSVDLAFTVLATGGVGWVRLLKAEPNGFFERAAIEGVRGWRFAPALRDGVPVECRVKTRLRFTLADVATMQAGGAAADGLAPPAYPPAAREARLEGHVEVDVTVDARGRVARAEVISAMPRGDFERAALAAVRAWRLPPADGPRVLRRRFDFSLPDSPPRPPAATLIAASPLPAEACEQGVAGWVRLEIDTDADGRILAARVLASEPTGLFVDAALSMARRSRVAPAWRDGHPVAATGLLTLNFSPDSSACPEAGAGDGRSGPRRPAAPRVSGVLEEIPGRPRGGAAVTIAPLVAGNRPPMTAGKQR